MKRRPAWWERRLGALNLTRRQHRTVVGLVRGLLAGGLLGAVYRTTRGTCAACALREPGACSCRQDPVIVVCMGAAWSDPFAWVDRDGLACVT